MYFSVNLQLLLLTVILFIFNCGAAGKGTTVVKVLFATSSSNGAGTISGITLGFEVGGKWLESSRLSESVAASEVVETSRTLALWPSRLRVKIVQKNPPLVDAWGLKEIVISDVFTGASFEVLQACEEQWCDYDETSTETFRRWVWSDTEYNVYDIPSTKVQEWLSGPWSECCCPSRDTSGGGCTPGERSREVKCSQDGAGWCQKNGAPPASVEPCEDYSQCPYDPFCPLGVDHDMDCDAQAVGLLGLLMLVVVCAGISCRFCQLVWFTDSHWYKKFFGPSAKLTLQEDPAIRPGPSRYSPKIPPLSVALPAAFARDLNPVEPSVEPERRGEGQWPPQRERPLDTVPPLVPTAAVPRQAGNVNAAICGCGSSCIPQDKISSSGGSRSSYTPGDFEELGSSGISRLLGTWFYITGRYHISRTPMGHLRFDEQISTGQWVFGVLDHQGDWFQGVLRYRDSLGGRGKADHGKVRLKHVKEKDTIVSNFQFPDDSLWGEDVVAYKVDQNTQRTGTMTVENDVAPTQLRASTGYETSSSDVAEGTKAQKDSFFQGTMTGFVEALTNQLGLGTNGTGQAQASSAASGKQDVDPDSKATGLRFFSENTAGKREPTQVPRVMCVECPHQQAACAGDYDVVPDEKPNGYPAWKKRDSQRWIYSGVDGKWYIGGPSSQEKKFDCASGYVFRDKRHHGVTPDLIGGPWERGDGSAWHRDPNIIVSADPTDNVDQKVIALAMDVANDMLRTQEDSPGVYVVVHSNTAVSSSVVPSPPVVARLTAGTAVNVLEVVRRTDEQRIRGRIEQPAGWISLKDTQDGYRWAVREQPGISDASTKDSSNGKDSGTASNGSRPAGFAASGGSTLLEPSPLLQSVAEGLAVQNSSAPQER